MLKDFAGKHGFIHGIKVASPCNADWNSMTGDERARFCQSCKLNVYNISEMTTKEAEKLIRENEEKRLCIRLYRRKDGTVITRDCPRGLAVIRRRTLKCFAAVLATIGGITAFLYQKILFKPQPTQSMEIHMVESAPVSSISVVQGQMSIPKHGSR